MICKYKWWAPYFKENGSRIAVEEKCSLDVSHIERGEPHRSLTNVIQHLPKPGRRSGV